MYDLSGTEQMGQRTQAELEAACERMARELMSGVKHGFFEMTVTVQVSHPGKKAITIKAGKCFRFVVSD
jgi:hypothetical protein